MTESKMYKSIVDLIDAKISDDPMQKELVLTESQTMAFMGSVKQLYTEGRLLYQEGGYKYRGVLLKLDPNYQFLAG